LRETVTTDGPITLEGMFEVGYSLITTAGSAGGSTADPPAHFFKQPQAWTAMPADPRIASSANRKTAPNQTTPKSVLPDRYAMRWPPISGGKVAWPKGVPRIAKLYDEPLKLNSRAALRTSSPKPILIPRVMAARSNTTIPKSAELAKTCRVMAITAHPTQRAGSGVASAQAQRNSFQECVAKRSQKLAQLS
jgi:hypothetical protein